MVIADLTTRCGELDVAFAPAGIQDYAVLPILYVLGEEIERDL